MSTPSPPPPRSWSAPPEAADDDPFVCTLMTHHLVGIAVDAGLTVALQLMASHELRHLPVFDASGCLGLLHEVDVLRGIGMWLADEGPLPRARTFLRRAVTVRQTDRRSKVALRMQAGVTDAVLVTDGATVLGIVTATDLIRSLAREVRTAVPNGHTDTNVHTERNGS